MENLNVATLPLVGKHLIEASAGTGKTFNITRIYLRLLLEKKLTVEQILVMTFSKDATQEIKARVGAFIRQALTQWSELVESDPFFKTLAEKISAPEAFYLLNQALLFLDEAAIFTIHGFCKRVLSQHAFSSSVSFNAQMEVSSDELRLQACQDFYRLLSKSDAEAYLLMAQFWATPESFVKVFYKALVNDITLTHFDEQQLKENVISTAKKALQGIQQHHELIEQALINSKTGADKALRIEELTQLTHWLNSLSLTTDFSTLTMPSDFIDGRRYGRSKVKAELSLAFEQANILKLQVKDIAKQLLKAQAFVIAKQGIYAIRAQVIKSKQQQNILDFDDLIATLAEVLARETKQTSKTNEQINSQGLADILYQQYPVALVDEFQDTDPKQFAILKAVYFSQAQAAIYMIGDPKQAIYGFRGGDIFAYLQARDDCDYQWLMDTNWRSSPEMITAYNRLFYGAPLDSKGKAVFDYGIDYLPVKASPVAQSKCLAYSHENTPRSAMQFVHFQGGDLDECSTAQLQKIMATWCAQEILRLLTAEKKQAQHRVNVSDIAILVRDTTEAKLIKSALSAADLGSVFLSNKGNLFKSEEAKQLLLLLKSILYVENDRLFTAGLSSALLGIGPEALYQLQHDDLAWQSLKLSFIALRDKWHYQGFITMALKLLHERFAIASEQKDRTLTNVIHLFELLQAASVRYQQSQELLFWFEQQVLNEGAEHEAELRLESDDNLIRIITQHGSKGLEYPVVFIPFSSKSKTLVKSASVVEYHDQQKRLIMSLGADDAALQAMRAEAFAESIRLLYVAITRAEQRCYLLTAAFKDCHLSPLGLALAWPKEVDISENLAALVQEQPAAIGLENITDSQFAPFPVFSQITQSQVNVASFSGKIERDWWLSSFTALSKNIRSAGVSSPDRDEKSLGVNLAADLDEPAIAQQSRLAFQIEKGAHTGNFLHEILEHADFAHVNWEKHIEQPLLTFKSNQLDREALIAWLEEIINAPLTMPDQSGARLTLAQLSWQQTLREKEFYFPMNGASTQALTQLLTQHRKQSPINLALGNAIEQVMLPAYRELKGMMHGFIDLIFCHQGKYYVADYKSTYLGDSFEQYSQAHLQQNIEHRAYDLQYLIYALALHRQLALTVDGYQINEHFGGVYYLYLRGMTTNQTYAGHGVYHRKISADTLMELDELFAQDALKNE